MELKSRIIDLLKKHDHTYSELAKYVGLTEEQLDTVLQNNSIEIRTLESISKAIQVPLYSFFRDPDGKFKDTVPVYTNSIWVNEEEALKKEISRLKDQVAVLRKELGERDAMLEALENELKRK